MCRHINMIDVPPLSPTLSSERLRWTSRNQQRMMELNLRLQQMPRANRNKFSSLVKLLISQYFLIKNPIFKNWGHKRSGSPWDAPSTKIEISPQTFDTTLGWASGRFKSHALICGAQPNFGEQKMTLWEHFVCSPLRCLKSFQSSPSWSQRGWS